MSEKRLNGRIVNKHDIEANWLKATNFIPMLGEIIVYDADALHSVPRVKIGDGETIVSSLPFFQIQHDWNMNDENDLAYVKNRTHWEERGYNYTYGGDYENYEYFVSSDGGLRYIKMDDQPLLSHELIGATGTVMHRGSVMQTFSIAAESDLKLKDGYISINDGDAVSVFKDGSVIFVTEDRQTKLDRGLYLLDNTPIYTGNLSKEYFVERLDEKYIPDTIARKDDIQEYIDEAILGGAW